MESESPVKQASELISSNNLNCDSIAKFRTNRIITWLLYNVFASFCIPTIISLMINNNILHTLTFHKGVFFYCITLLISCFYEHATNHTEINRQKSNSGVKIAISVVLTIFLFVLYTILEVGTVQIKATLIAMMCILFVSISFSIYLLWSPFNEAYLNYVKKRLEEMGTHDDSEAQTIKNESIDYISSLQNMLNAKKIQEEQ